MRFHPQKFDKLLGNLGQAILWRRSWACSCFNPDTGSADPKHSVCKGKGRIWDAPVETVAAPTNHKVSPQMIAAGLWDSGDVLLSIPQDSVMWDNAGRLDRVTLLNATEVFSLPLRRGAPSERLLFKPASITRVFWMHPSTGAVTNGVFPTVSDDGVLTWPAENAPPPGTNYSISGLRYSEFYIYDQIPSNRNMHSGMRLPKKVQLRKWDLFGR